VPWLSSPTLGSRGALGFNGGRPGLGSRAPRAGPGARRDLELPDLGLGAIQNESVPSSVCEARRSSSWPGSSRCSITPRPCGRSSRRTAAGCPRRSRRSSPAPSAWTSWTRPRRGV